MSTVNGFQVGSETLKYNYESLENYNTPNFSSSSSKAYAIGDYVMYNGKLYKCTTATTGGTWNANNWTEAILSDDTSGLKNALNYRTGTEEITEFLDKQYIATNGTTVDVTSTTSNNQFVCGVFDCQPGDRFTITGQAGSTPRLWAFVDSASPANKLDGAANGAVGNSTMIVAPENTSKLVVNFAKAQPHSLYKGVMGSELSKDYFAFANANATIYPTGDTTNRRLDLLNALTKYKRVYLSPGNYTISDKLDMPDGTTLCGAGESTVISYASESSGLMIECGSNCQIYGIKFDGGLSTRPENASTNRHCIRVKNNKQTLEMHDCWVVGFGGYGVRVNNTGYNGLSSVLIDNCYFSFNGCGVNFESKGEYGIISNSAFIDNYMGAYVGGGNNIITGCTLERNSVGGHVDGSGSENSGHGAFIGCSFNHNTNRGLEIINTNNGYLVSGCQFFRNENYELVINCEGVNVVGCNFGLSSKLLFSTAAMASFTGNMFASSPTLTYTGTSTTHSADNYKFDGTKIDIVIPRGPSNEDTDIIASTRLSDYKRINAVINASNLWKNVGSADWESVLIPVKANTGITINMKSGVYSYFGFLRDYSAPVNDALAPMSEVSGYTNVWLRQSSSSSTLKRSFIVPSDVRFFYYCVKSNGVDASPDHLIIDGIDIITGENIERSIYGGSAGTLNTLMSKASKLICTIIDDDAQSVQSMEALYTVCEANGVKATIASLTDKWENNAELKNKLYDMEDKGYHIVLHAHTQDSNNGWQDFESRVADYTANFALGLRQMHQAGFANCDFWVTPGGVQYDGCQALARQYGMKALIAGVNGINIIGDNTLNNDGSGNLDRRDNSRWRIRRANLRPVDDPTWTLQNLKDLALAGASHASWLILCTHSYQWTDQDDHAARMASFITYARSLGYEFMTLGEAWTYKQSAYDLYDMT